MRSTPSSVSFWVTHSGRSPLVGAKATVISGSGRGCRDTGRRDQHVGRIGPPGASPAGPRCHPARTPTTGAVGGDHRLAGPEPQDVEEVVDVRLREHGAAGSATKTMAAAATRTGSGPDGGPAPGPVRWATVS